MLCVRERENGCLRGGGEKKLAAELFGSKENPTLRMYSFLVTIKDFDTVFLSLHPNQSNNACRIEKQVVRRVM